MEGSYELWSVYPSFLGFGLLVFSETLFLWGKWAKNGPEIVF